jgi:hypothetical protein
MAGTQQTIDFDKEQKYALLRSIRIPRDVCSRHHVKPSSVKQLLEKIAGFSGGCYAKQETISAQTDMSERVIRRAIRVLEDLSFIACERRKLDRGLASHCRATGNHYWIVWNELASRRDLDEKQESCQKQNQDVINRAQCTPEHQYQSAKTVDQPAILVYQSAKTVDQPATLADSIKVLNVFKSTKPDTEWGKVEKNIFSLGIMKARQLCVAARDRGEAPVEFANRVTDALNRAQSPSMRRLFRDPFAAVVHFLENGDVWPASESEIRSADPQLVLIRLDKTKKKDEEAMKERYFVSVVHAGRKSGASDDEIRAVLRKQLTEQDLEKRKWL